MNYKKILMPNLFRILLLIVLLVVIYYGEAFIKDTPCTPCCEIHYGIPFTYHDDYSNWTSGSNYFPCPFNIQNKAGALKKIYRDGENRFKSEDDFYIHWLIIDIIFWYLVVSAFDLLFHRKEFFKPKTKP